MSTFKFQSGFTLIELSVVLLILIVLAGLVIPYIGGTSSAAMCNATDVTMQNLKKVIMERYYVDTLGYLPKKTKDSQINYSLRYLATKPDDWNLYDSITQTGWRQGGYVQSSFTLDAKYVDDCAKNIHGILAVNLKDVNSACLHTGTYTHEAFKEGDIVFMDGWGRPIVFQVPTVAQCKSIMNLSVNPKEEYCARLVSAGAGSGLQTGDADIETPIASNRPTNSDDRILYLNAPTPPNDVNPSCE